MTAIGTERAGADGGDPGSRVQLIPVEDLSEQEEVSAAALAGQLPPPGGAWLLVTAVDGSAEGEYQVQFLPPGAPLGYGGDVLVRLAPVPGPARPGLRAGVWAVLAMTLVPVAAWDLPGTRDWPEVTRSAAAFAHGAITELVSHGADVTASRPVDVTVAVTGPGLGLWAGPLPARETPAG